MEYRKLGNSELELSVVTFGTYAIGGWMWEATEPKTAIEAMQAAYDLGVTSIDTAPIYGLGLSEELVAEAIKNISRDKVQILTKYGLRWDTTKGEFFYKSVDNSGKPFDLHRYSGKESVIEECENSLRRLKTDYIDLYQIHWSDKVTPIEETMEAVSRLIEQGKVRYAGVCNYTIEKMGEAEKVVPLVSNQIPYSMLRRDIEKETVPYCIQNKKGVLAYSTLQRGLLAGKIKPDHTFGEGDTRANNMHYTKENIIRVNTFLETLKPLAESKNATLAQLVIRWTIEQPGITIALVSARNPQQAILNAKVADIKLSPDEIKFINLKLNSM